MNLIGRAEAARRLNVSERTLRKLDLPGAVRVGSRTKFREDAIADFIQRGGCRPLSGDKAGTRDQAAASVA